MNRSVHFAVGLARNGVREAYTHIKNAELRLGSPKTQDDGVVSLPFQVASPTENEWIVGTAHVDMLAGRRPTTDDVAIDVLLTGHGDPPTSW